MAKLNQIIAVANGTKSRTQSGVTELYHKLQAKTLLEGISRTYRPKDEDGESLPPESKRVQFRVSEALAEASAIWTTLFDAVATQDVANCSATASVKIAGTTLIESVPVTHLLFLEKQLNDIASFIEKIPTLDPAYDWALSDEADCYATSPIETVRTKKIPRNHVKAEATKEHPAQVDVYPEDVVVGYWTKVDFSGAMPARERNKIMDRVRVMQDAVKSAREEANSIDVVQQHNGKIVFDYLFGNTAG